MRCSLDWAARSPNDPKRLIVCESRGNELKQTGGEVQVLLGCPRVEIDVK